MISISMQALLDDGDEVLVPMPDYPLWTCQSERNAITMSVMKNLTGIRILMSKITSNTKAIVVISPIILQVRSILRMFLNRLWIARQNDLIIFADEIYDAWLWMVRNILQSLVLHQMSSACL